MNLVQKARDVVQGVSAGLADQLDQILARINFVWAVGHDPETGTHKALVFNSSVTTQTTVGVAGTADALPANPLGYLPLTLSDGTTVVVPYYTAE